MNRAKVGFFSFTEITDPNEHRAYNEWHQLDHLPEQHQIPGVAHGQRWVSTPACRAARAVDDDLGGRLHYVTLYLMTDPVPATLDAFAELGRRLAELGRFHRHRRAHLVGAWHVLEAHAAPRVQISAETVPWRPHRGIYVVVEQPTAQLTPGEGGSGTRLDAWVRWVHERHVADLLAVDGVAGVWSFATSPLYTNSTWQMRDSRITVCWLDGDPLEVAAEIRPFLDERWDGAPVWPLIAGPWETITAEDWSWFDGDAPAEARGGPAAGGRGDR